MNPSADLVNKLWRLCALLRKDGVTYQQYVTELTYLLFLKMASEQKDESRIPEQYRWSALKSANETEVLTRYRQALIDLGDGTKIADRSNVAIFQNAATIVREPVNLRKLIDAIDGLHWYSEERDAFGDAYEGLLQKMAEETKRGAGQYFTPRVLIDVIVHLMQPEPGEVIQDPAAGTGLPDRRRPLHARDNRRLFHAVAQAAGVPAQPSDAWRRERARHLPPASDEPASAQYRPRSP